MPDRWPGTSSGHLLIAIVIQYVRNRTLISSTCGWIDFGQWHFFLLGHQHKHGQTSAILLQRKQRADASALLHAGYVSNHSIANENAGNIPYCLKSGNKDDALEN